MSSAPQQVSSEIERLHRDPERSSRFFCEEGRPPGLADLSSRPWQDFVPPATLARQDLLLVETGGTTGPPIRVPFTRPDFQANFVDCFVRNLGPQTTSFKGPWLFVGPTGPHAMGFGADGCAAALSGQPCFRVDMDPRWLRRLDEGFLRDRYLDHVVAQALDVMQVERVAVLFSTPPLLQRLGETLQEQQKERIRGVFWGGVGVTTRELLALQGLFPKALFQSGFGNSLVGLFPQVGTREGLPLFGSRGGSHFFRVEDEQGNPVQEGASGTLVVGRQDACWWLPGIRERDRVQALRDHLGAPAFQPLKAQETRPQGKVIY